MDAKQKSRKWRRIVAVVAALVVLALLLMLRPWLTELNRSGKGFYTVSSADELATVPWYENTVWISDPELTDEQLSAFLQSNSISELRLVRCEKITSKGLVGLEHSCGLSVLDVARHPVDDTISVPLAKLHHIERLDLESTQIHELSDEVFESNEDLWSLDVGGCHINRRLLARCAAHPTVRSLDLTQCTGVGEGDFALLAGSQSLQHIDLGSATVSLRVLDSICAIPTLRQLWFHYATGVTPEEVVELQRRHPKIEIAYAQP